MHWSAGVRVGRWLPSRSILGAGRAGQGRAGCRFGCTVAVSSAPLRRTPQGRNEALSIKSTRQNANSSFAVGRRQGWKSEETIGEAAAAVPPKVARRSGVAEGDSFQASPRQSPGPSGKSRMGTAPVAISHRPPMAHVRTSGRTVPSRADLYRGAVPGAGADICRVRLISPGTSHELCRGGQLNAPK